MLARTSEDGPVEAPVSGWPTTVLGGLPIVQCSMSEAADEFVARALRARGSNGPAFYSTSANGQVIASCSKDKDALALMMAADQIHADGMPMVFFSRLFSARPIRERIATTDLVHAVAQRAVQAGLSFYFLGATEEVNRNAVRAMRQAYPDLLFAGRRNGYFTPEDEDAVIADIQAARPDILWIGLGFPHEQKFVSRNLDRLRGIGVIKTSGGLFDFISGKNRRAPLWMQNWGLEWAYRIYLEPTRLAWRYLVTNPVAIYALFRHSR